MAKRNYVTSRFERFSYGSFFFSQNVIYVIQFQFLSYFYTEEVGLTLGATSLLLLFARLWDAFNDPIMGAIVDKMNFKTGKYIPWLRFVTYAVPLATVFVFANIGNTYNTKLFFAYVTYIVWGMLYTVSDAPLFSLSTVMTNQIYERDQLISLGRMGAGLAAISSAVFMSIKDMVGWTFTAGIYAFVAFVLMMPLQFTAKERFQPNRKKNMSFKMIFIYMFKNKYLLIYYFGYLAITATNALQTIVIYFANSNLGDEGMVTIILAICILPIIIISPFLPKLIELFGKRRLTIYSSFIFIGLCVIQYLFGYDNITIFLIIASIRTLFMQIPFLIYGMFTADCIEYGAYITGERTEGIAFSIQTFVTKLGGGITAVICLQLLKYYGYVEQAVTQSQRTLDGIWNIMNIVPVIGFAIMIIIMIFFYKLEESDVELMRKEILLNSNKEVKNV